MTRLPALFAALTCLVLAPAVGGAITLTLEDLEQLDAKESRYKISPEMESSIFDLVRPFELDSQLPGGYLLDGITIEKFYLRFTLIKGSEQFHVCLLPPVVQAEASVATASFKLVTEGEVNDETLAALTTAIAGNDDGTFWPVAPLEADGEGRRIAPSARKVHFTELIGDFFFVLLLIAFFAALGAFKMEFASRSMQWWWGLVGVGAYAFAVRLVLFFVFSEHVDAAAWAPSSELPHVSIAWYLNTVGRFSAMSLTLISLLNLIAGVAAVVGVYMLLSFMFEGTIAPVMGALFVASWPAHAALSCSLTVMTPFATLLIWSALAQFLYLRTRDVRAHLLGAALTLFAVFARPEAWVLVLPLLVHPFFAVERKAWTKVSFFGPIALQLLAVAARLATLTAAPDSPDAFLTTTIAPVAFFNNVGVWLFGLGRMPFAAVVLWAVGIASKPWKRDLRGAVLMLAWFLLGLGIYYHVDLTGTLQGGRVSLFFAAPLAWLVASGTEFIMSLKHRRKSWALAVLALWLLLAPVIHMRALEQDYRATYDANFLMEA